jgi:hypothetical protein
MLTIYLVSRTLLSYPLCSEHKNVLIAFVPACAGPGMPRLTVLLLKISSSSLSRALGTRSRHTSLRQRTLPPPHTPNSHTKHAFVMSDVIVKIVLFAALPRFSSATHATKMSDTCGLSRALCSSSLNCTFMLARYVHTRLRVCRYTLFTALLNGTSL